MIRSEQAYKIEKYRWFIYAPFLLVLALQIFSNFYYGAYFKDFIWNNVAILGGVVIALLLVLCGRQRSRFVSFYALMVVKELKHKSYERYLWHCLIEKVRTLPYIPVLISLALAIAYYFLIKGNLIPRIPNSETNNGFGLMWQVHASILGLVFMTLSFLIGLLGADELNKKIDAGKRLAKKVKFTSITILNTLLTLWVGYTALRSDVSLWQEGGAVFAMVFMVVSVIYLLQNFIKYLFGADLLKSLILEELRSDLRYSLENEIEQKIGHQLFEKYSDERNIYVGYETQDQFNRPISGGKKGMVIDVDIIALGRFSKQIVDTIAVKNYHKSTTQNVKAVLIKSFVFNIAITDRRDTIAFVAKGEPEKVNFFAQAVYVVGERGPEPDKQLDENIKQLTDAVAEYIKTSPNKAIETMEYLGILIDESLRILKEHQIEFNYENSKQVTHFDWMSISQVVYGLDAIFKEIYRNGNLDLIRKTVSFIDKRISSAVEFKNHFLFKEFSGNYVRLYYLALRSEGISQRSREEVVKLIKRKIEDIFKYGLKLGQDDIADPEETKFHIGVALDIQRIVRELNKAALDHQDNFSVEVFAKTLEIVSSTVKHYRDVSLLESEVEMIKMSAGGKELVPEKEKKIKHLEEIIKLNRSLNQVDIATRFALGAWTVEMYRRGKIDEKFLAQVLRKFQDSFKNIRDLADAFFEVKRTYQQDGMNLSYWEMEGREDSGVHSVVMDWLTYFYVLTALRLVPKVSPSEQFLAGKDLHEFSSSYLEVILKEVETVAGQIETAKSVWKAILPEKTDPDTGKVYDDTDKKDSLFELHKRGIEKRKEEETEFIAKALIDDEIWKKFKKEFFAEYEKLKSIKKVFKRYGVYRDETQKKSSDDVYFGIKTLDFKYHFIKDWYVSSYGVAENFASAMVRGEEEKISKEILKRIDKLAAIKNVEQVIAGIDEMIAIVKNRGYNPDTIFIGNWVKLYELRNQKGFVPEADPADLSYQGKYNGLRIYYTHGELHNKIMVIDMKKIGVLEQQQVEGAPNQEVYMSVRSIKGSDINEWIKKDAAIIKRDGVQMAMEEIRKYMGERVLLDILQKFELKNIDRKAGLYRELID
jgi:hypothetical protein